jgi:hypothetical protein
MIRANLEGRLEREALYFEFPPTPDIAAVVSRRLAAGPLQGWARRLPALTLARSLAIVALAALAALLAVPSARATVFEALRVGVVRILLGRPEPTAAPTASGAAPAASDTAKERSAGAPPGPTFASGTAPGSQAPPELALEQLAGETTLAESERLAGFEVRLPTYPPDLGPPDRVYFQSIAPTVVLVWADPASPERARMSLFILTDTVLIEKVGPKVVERTEVGGQPAYWTEGPYMLSLRAERELALRYLVQGHVLIWTDGRLTYRLESGLPLAEAVRIAESLGP